jgi:hypothetical protein
MLASEGHKVYAADDQSLSPGNHSRYLTGRFVYPSPRRDTAGFLAELEWIARESLKLIEPIVAELGYTGQISFDLLVTDDGLTFVECNPRATDGLLLMPREELAAGLLAPRPERPVPQPARVNRCAVH